VTGSSLLKRTKIEPIVVKPLVFIRRKVNFSEFYFGGNTYLLANNDIYPKGGARKYQQEMF
jgi:hypothetical protein